jgi:hypothetical protein
MTVEETVSEKEGARAKKGVSFEGRGEKGERTADGVGSRRFRTLEYYRIDITSVRCGKR